MTKPPSPSPDACSSRLHKLGNPLRRHPQQAANVANGHPFRAQLRNGLARELRGEFCSACGFLGGVAGCVDEFSVSQQRQEHAAMRVLAAKSGMTFTYKGATGEVPRQGSYVKQSADIIIAYTTPAKTNFPLAGSTAGLGGFADGWKSTSNGSTTTYTAGINKGYLVVDTPDLLAHFKPGFGTGVRRGNLLLHELGHVVGLGHMSNARVLMNPTLSSYTPNGYAAGDAAGLALVGRKAGCIPGW